MHNSAVGFGQNVACIILRYFEFVAGNCVCIIQQVFRKVFCMQTLCREGRRFCPHCILQRFQQSFTCLLPQTFRGAFCTHIFVGHLGIDSESTNNRVDRASEHLRAKSRPVEEFTEFLRARFCRDFGRSFWTLL